MFAVFLLCALSVGCNGAAAVACFRFGDVWSVRIVSVASASCSAVGSIWFLYSDSRIRASFLAAVASAVALSVELPCLCGVREGVVVHAALTAATPPIVSLPSCSAPLIDSRSCVGRVVCGGASTGKTSSDLQCFVCWSWVCAVRAACAYSCGSCLLLSVWRCCRCVLIITLRKVWGLLLN